MITFSVNFLLRFLPTSWSRHRVELERIVRFIIIGGVSFLINYGLYVLISRIIWPAGNRTLENFIATCLTCILNYLAHRSWTFRSQGAHRAQATRYILVAVSAVLLQSLLFWIGYRLLSAPDLLVIFLVALIIPFYTYVAHKLFTFRSANVV